MDRASARTPATPRRRRGRGRLRRLGRASAAPAAALIALAATVAAGCGAGDPAAEGRVPLVATTTHVADFARAVGGDRVAVHQILRPGADPHDAEPRPSDARAVAEARLVVRSGGDIDRFLDPLLDRGAAAERGTLTLSDHAGAGDETHWWQDPRAVERATRALAAELGRIDPAGAGAYAARAADYAARLRRLDRAVADCIARVPRRQRRLVTTHDALGAFARRYGIDEVGTVLPARAAEAQPSAADAARLVDRIRAAEVRAVFPESALNPALERAIAREAGVRVGRPLWTDSLGPPGSGAETYLAATAANTDALVEGFTGGAERCRPAA